MPVARIITVSPAESEELRRQLTAAGYSVKFAAPDEEFSDADIVVAAANVHADYALQYASEVASQAGATVIVARGVVPGSDANAPSPAFARQQTGPEIHHQEPQRGTGVPAAGVLFGTANELKEGLTESGAEIRETLSTYSARIGTAWQQFRQQRELAAEQKRLEREQREMRLAEQRRELQQKRMAAEAQMVAERERLRAQREAEQERLRAQRAAEQEQILRQQQEMRRAAEQERERIAAERLRIEQERPAPAMMPPAANEQIVAAPIPVATNPTPPVIRRTVPPPARRQPVRAHRAAPRRTSAREQRFQRAAIIASMVALVAMIGFAVAMNIRPSSPMPHSMVQNPVQEQSPFGTASITPSPAKTAVATPATHSALPQRDATPVATPAKASPAKPSATRRVRRASADNYVAEDEVVIHHYPQPTQKHPPATQTRASVPKYSDRD